MCINSYNMNYNIQKCDYHNVAQPKALWQNLHCPKKEYGPEQKWKKYACYSILGTLGAKFHCDSSPLRKSVCLLMGGWFLPRPLFQAFDLFVCACVCVGGKWYGFQGFPPKKRTCTIFFLIRVYRTFLNPLIWLVSLWNYEPWTISSYTCHGLLSCPSLFRWFIGTV